MKKLVIVIAVFFSVPSFAQDKGYVGLSIGASNPLGEYGECDIDNDHAGFAMTGIFYDVSFGYKLGKNFGIAAMVRRQSHEIDKEEMVDQYNDFTLTDANGNPITINVESDPMKTTFFMAGGYGSFPINEKLSFESRLLIGLLSATLPEEELTFSAGMNTFSDIQKSTTATTFAFGVGAGLKYNIAPRICLLANLDYTTAHPEFKEVEFDDGAGDVETDTFSQPVSTLNVGVGIGYRL